MTPTSHLGLDQALSATVAEHPRHAGALRLLAVIAVASLRAVLSAAPTDTTKEN